MAEKTTWIKLDRNILDWGWYKDTNTKAVFLHLLLTANIKLNRFLGVEIQRGEVATSQSSLAKSLGISIQAVRTALNHLKSTGEITTKQHPRFTVISIVKYDLYQGNQQAEQQASNRRPTGDQQQSKNIRMKEEKNIYTPTASTEDRLSYGGVFLTDAEYDELEGMVEDKMAFLDVLDRVGEWLKDNPRAKNRHKGVVKTFLRNDGFI